MMWAAAHGQIAVVEFLLQNVRTTPQKPIQTPVQHSVCVSSQLAVTNGADAVQMLMQAHGLPQLGAGRTVARRRTGGEARGPPCWQEWVARRPVRAPPSSDDL